MYFLIQTLTSALIIAGVSEVARRSSFMAALLISLPLVSILSFCWVYADTRDTQKIIDMSYAVFWLVIPSLLFFLALPFLLKMGVRFIPAMLGSSLALIIFYSLMLLILRMAGK